MIGFAIRNDNQGWRAVDSVDEVGIDETFSDIKPDVQIPIIFDIDGFEQAIKDILGGIVAAAAIPNAWALSTALNKKQWGDVQALIIDAKEKSNITTEQYNAIKKAAASSNIPINL